MGRDRVPRSCRHNGGQFGGSIVCTEQSGRLIVSLTILHMPWKFSMRFRFDFVEVLTSVNIEYEQ